MESVIVEIAKQSPSIVVIAFIVMQFLRHLGKMNETLKEISGECHQLQRESHEIHRASTEAIRENTRVLGQVIQACKS